MRMQIMGTGGLHGKFVFAMGSCPTFRKSIFLIDGLFTLAEVAKKGHGDDVELQLEKGTPNSPRDLLDGILLAQQQHSRAMEILYAYGWRVAPHSQLRQVWADGAALGGAEWVR